MFLIYTNPFYIIRLERGEEIIYSIKEFLKKEKIPSGILWGIGALEELEIGYFQEEKKEYIRKKINKTMEILNLTGSVSYIDDKPYLHIHGTFGDENFNAYGGHFFYGKVGATAEIYILKLKKRLKRVKDKIEPFYFLDLPKFLRE